MHLEAKYPTTEHQHAAEAIVGFFSHSADVLTVNLTNSCARGQASPDSCLDIVVIAHPQVMKAKGDAIEEQWNQFYNAEKVFSELKQVGKYTEVHLDIIDGRFSPQPRDEVAEPDGFELEIGNYLAYSVPLWQGDDYLDQLKEKWLPYYDEMLRNQRQVMVRRYCLNNLEHIPLLVDRGIHFQAFHRLYLAFREFLQVLFITHKTYPIAYDKWIREQIEEILEIDDLYPRLLAIFEIESFESDELKAKAEEVKALLNQFVVE